MSINKVVALSVALDRRNKSKEAGENKELLKAFASGAGKLLSSYSFGFHSSVRPETLAVALAIYSGANTYRAIWRALGSEQKRGIEKALKGDLISHSKEEGYKLTPSGMVAISHLFTCLERGVPSRSVLIQKYILTSEAFRVQMWPRYYSYFDEERTKLKKVHEIRQDLNPDNQQDKK
jgi:hypothetical protein